MAFAINSFEPVIDREGSKWIDVKIADQSFRVKVFSSLNPTFRAKNGYLARETESIMNSVEKDEPTDKQAASIVALEDHHVSLIAKHIVGDWEDVVDENGKPVPYSVDQMAAIMKGAPSIRDQVMTGALEVSIRLEEKKEETAEKPEG